MNADEFSEIIQEIAQDDTKGAIVLVMKKDDTFNIKEFGEITYFEAIGLLSTALHDYQQDPYDLEHLALYHGGQV